MRREKQFKSIESGMRRLILVEGPGDFAVLQELARQLRLLSQVQISSYGGKQNLTDVLQLLPLDARFNQLQHIGIVRDADQDENAFGDVIQQIEGANRYHQQQKPPRQLPIPKQPETPSKPVGNQSLRLTIFIVSDNNRSGMLESLFLDTLSTTEKEAYGCVDNFFHCLSETGIDLKTHALPKLKLRALILAKQADHAATNNKETRDDVLSIANMISMKWWQQQSGVWSNPSFDKLKNFLQQVANE